MQQIYDLTGMKILVTGASSGIGKATAIQLSQLGAQVICCGRDEARLQETVQQLAVGEHCYRCFDLLQVAEVSSWIQEVSASVHGLHGLVHAAGLQSSSPVFRIKTEQWQRMQDANVECFIELVRGFQKNGVYLGERGRIVVLSTVLTSRGSAGRSAYAATKGAIEGMLPSLALELAPKGICVNGVAPAFVKTPMFDDVARFWSQEQLQAIEARHPLGFGTPADVAAAIGFLLGEGGRWITGTVLRVDGGYSVA